MSIVEDGWLADRFGHPVWTVSDESAAAVREHAASHHGRALYQAKVPAQDVATLLELGSVGLVPVNLNLTLARGTEPLDDMDEGEVEVLEFAELPEADRAAVLDIAEHSFTLTRFHLDPRVPRGTANAIKRGWLDSYRLGTRGERAYVARMRGVSVGFLAVIASGAVRVIDLIAVAEQARNTGAGRALVRRFVADSAGFSDHVAVGTQGANVIATRFYEAAGFRAASAAYDLHRLED